MVKYPRLGSASVALEYLNNHIPKKVVVEVLKGRGITDEALALIDWNKSNFPGPRFKAIFPKELSQWPAVPTKTPDINDVPFVKKAIDALYYDQGIGKPDAYELPEKFMAGRKPIDWVRVNKLLEKLDKPDENDPEFTELQTFCYGEHEEIQKIAKRNGKDGSYANKAIESIFHHMCLE